MLLRALLLSVLLRVQERGLEMEAAWWGVEIVRKGGRERKREARERREG